MDGDLVELTHWYPHGQTTVQLIVSDGIESHTCSLVVAVQDTVAPLITVAKDIEVETDPGVDYATNVNLGHPNVFDTCDDDPKITNDAPEKYPFGETVVTWTVTDASGNVGTAEQIVNVVDREAPVIVCSEAITVGADFGEITATVSLVPPSVTDNVDPTPVVKNNAPPLFGVGTTCVEWSATDASGNRSICHQSVTVINLAPEADAGEDIVVECTSHHGAEVTLDGTNSWDPDGHELKYHWSAVAINFDDENSPTPTAVLPIGATTVTLTVTDEVGDSGTADVIVIVEDTTAPAIEIVELSDHVLWPPNHRMVPVEIAITVHDDCVLPEQMIVVVSVTSSEPDNATGDGKTAGDVAGQDGFSSPVEIPVYRDALAGQWRGVAELRAERQGGQWTKILRHLPSCRPSRQLHRVDCCCPGYCESKQKREGRKKQIIFA